MNTEVGDLAGRWSWMLTSVSIAGKGKGGG